jgi:hypothetical protein
MWTYVLNLLRPFKGVRKQYRASYVAICEFRSLEGISPLIIAAVVTFHTFYI